MGKAKALPRPYFTGEGRVVGMLGAALGTPRGSGCPWDQGSAKAAETAISSRKKSRFRVLVFFFFCPKREEWHLGAPACGAGCAAEGPCHLPAREPGPGCHLSPACGSAPGSCRQPMALGGLGMAWARPSPVWARPSAAWAQLGHVPHGDAAAGFRAPRSRGGSTKVFGLKQRTQNDAGCY